VDRRAPRPVGLAMTIRFVIARSEATKQSMQLSLHFTLRSYSPQAPETCEAGAKAAWIAAPAVPSGSR